MPENWRPDTPIGVFIKHHCRNDRAEKWKGRIFNGIGQAKEQIPRTLYESRRHHHEIEGVLEDSDMIYTAMR
jgi:hypothetical protein